MKLLIYTPMPCEGPHGFLSHRQDCLLTWTMDGCASIPKDFQGKKKIRFPGEVLLVCLAELKIFKVFLFSLNFSGWSH